MSTTSSKLERAKALIEQATALVKLSLEENESLKEQYNLEETARQLEIISSNSKGYAREEPSLDEILGDLGDTWQDDEGDEPNEG